MKEKRAMEVNNVKSLSKDFPAGNLWHNVYSLKYQSLWPMLQPKVGMNSPFRNIYSFTVETNFIVICKSLSIYFTSYSNCQLYANHKWSQQTYKLSNHTRPPIRSNAFLSDIIFAIAIFQLPYFLNKRFNCHFT